ncbi:hypothetical protein F66182_7542 [Fusarium sp. NRRL 66182]|nr:hypothetical protein F66182_7542 [Fusarium sp. NRRL 66182]
MKIAFAIILGALSTFVAAQVDRSQNCWEPRFGFRAACGRGQCTMSGRECFCDGCESSILAVTTCSITERVKSSRSLSSPVIGKAIGGFFHGMVLG